MTTGPLDRLDNRLERIPAAWFKGGLLVLYLLVVAVTMNAHEMWRDEMQAWLIARDSQGLVDLYQRRAYEGHPILWYLVISPAAALGRDPRLMQMVAWAISGLTMALLLFRGPFRRVELLLLPFGYFFLFEYGVKSRPYMLGCLILFGFCALWARRRQSTVALAVLLGLLAHLQVMFLIIAVAAAGFVALDRVLTRRPPTAYDYGALGIFAVAVLTAVASLLPPPDTGFATEWFFSFDIARAKLILRSLGGMISSTEWPLKRVAAVIAALVLLVMLFRWRRCPAAMAFFVVATGGLLAFMYVKYPGHPWHHGLFYVVLLATLWLARVAGSRELLPRLLFVLVLLVQAGVGVRAVAIDLNRTFSNGKLVARYLQDQGWAADPLVSIGDTAIVTVVGYLERDSVFNAEGGRFGSYFRLDTARLPPVDLEAFLTEADGFGPCVTLIAADLRETPDPTVLAAHGYRETARFFEGVTEHYVVYRREAGPCAGG